MESDSGPEEELSSSSADSDQEESGDDGLPSEVKDISFGELEEIRMKVGTKKFDAAVHKQDVKPTEEKSFSRRNKNRPSEQSSKKRVPLLRAGSRGKKKTSRDPRFDDLSGDFHADLWEKSFGFLNSVRTDEKKELRSEMRRTKDPHRKAEVIQLLTRMLEQEERMKSQKEQQRAKQEVQKQRAELLKQGKKPFYVKKSDQRKLEIATKFAQLQKSSQLDKFMEKKRKRNASRDRRNLPRQRSED